MEARTCTKCGECKPATVEYFTREKGYKHDLNSRCRVCIKEYRRQHAIRYRKTEAGRAARRAANKKWEGSEAGGAKHQAARKAWRERNREKRAQQHRDWRATLSEDHKRRIMKAGVAYTENRKARDPRFKLRMVISSRIAQSLQARGTSKRGRSWERWSGTRFRTLGNI